MTGARQMHLLALTWDVDRPGWLDPGVLDLARGLARLGASCEVVTVGAGPRSARVVDGVDVTWAAEAPPVLPPTEAYDFGRVLAVSTPASAAAERRCRQQVPDAVLAFGWQTGWTATTLRSSRGVPLVTMFETTAPGRATDGLDELGRMAAQTEWWLTYEARRVVSGTELVARQLRRSYRLPAEKVTVVPRAAHVPEPSDPADEIVVVAPAPVVAAVRERVGDRRTVHANDDVGDLRAGIVVVHDDTAPDLVLSAMASGAAVVVPEDGPLRGLVHARRSGLRTRRDAVEVARVVADLVERPDRARGLGRRARDRVAARHDPGDVAAAVLAVVRDAMDEEASLRASEAPQPLRPLLLRSPILGLVTDGGRSSGNGRHDGEAPA